MRKSRKIYIDIYHTVMAIGSDDFVKNEHLVHTEITSDIRMDDIVRSIRDRILDYYGDGLYIEGEEFEDISYLNILLLFGKDHQFILDYLDSIDNNKKVIDYQSGSSSLEKYESYLIIEDFYDDQDYEELNSILNSYNIKGIIKSKKICSYEKGAGDFEIQLMIALAIATPILDHYVKKALRGIEERLGKEYRAKYLNINPMVYKSAASILAEKPERFLRFQSANIVENELKVIFVTHKERITLIIDNKKGNIISSEVFDKSQTGI